MAANPLGGICYVDYDAESDTWLGPLDAGITVPQRRDVRAGFCPTLGLMLSDVFLSSVARQ